MENKRYKGIVLRWVEKGGYGFLHTQEIPRQVFFHARDWMRVQSPLVGEAVTFEVAPSRTPGKPDAGIGVTPVNSNPVSTAGVSGLAGGVQ